MKIYQKNRKNPVKLFDDPAELRGLKSGTEFSFDVMREEYFVVQLLLCECAGDYRITATGMDGRVTIYNTQVIDKFGRPFTQDFHTAAGQINPVYIGFDFSGLPAGDYEAAIHFDGAEQETVTLRFAVSQAAVQNHGYDELWRLSRLNWLNSTRAQDHAVVAPFRPVETDGKTIKLIGRKVELGADLQISQVYSYFDESVRLMGDVQLELLRAPAAFSVDGEDFKFSTPAVENLGDCATITVQGESAHLSADIRLEVRCEGKLEYFIALTPKADFDARTGLNYPFTEKTSVYNMGLGKHGGYFADVKTNWDGMRHDSLYTGTVNGGAMIRLKDEHYRTPLVNVYYNNLPIIIPEDTWDNHGAGTIASVRTPEGADFTSDAGVIHYQSGKQYVFRYEIFLTPFKPVDYKKHYSIRYYQSYHVGDREYKHLKRAEKAHLNYFNVHHGNSLHPYINYPFIETERLKKFIDTAAQKGIGVKLYYTAREMSNHTAELFCYKALGNEIIFQKKGQGLDTFSDRVWLRKYFGENIIPAWQVHYKSGPHKGDDDIAFIIQPDSRIENYYIEGLEWLVDKLGIKGLYIDDTSLDDVTLRRARKVLDRKGGLIDMHMWNHEEARAGDCSCMNIYTNILPFVDSLWIGEGFDCRKLSPDYIFTEVSGLMYGNMSEMLEGGGDLYAGMLYGMCNRYGWHVYNADKIYKIWDDFAIENARMLGYWHSECPIRTDCPDVLVTVYEKPDALLVAAYNFSEAKKSFRYQIDREKLPFGDYTVQALPLSWKDRKKAKKSANLAGENTLSGRDGVLFVMKKK